MKSRSLGPIAGIALAVALLAPQSAQAQANASIEANAVVQVQLTAVAGSDLDFGAVFPGTTRNVLASDLGAGSFEITGASNAEVTVDLTLPANLVNGGNNLPITFGANSAARNTTDDRGTATTFDPSAVETTRLDNATGELFVYVGGSVSPVGQPNGTYTGTIQLTTAYTGN